MLGFFYFGESSDGLLFFSKCTNCQINSSLENLFSFGTNILLLEMLLKKVNYLYLFNYSETKSIGTFGFFGWISFPLEQ